jgi:hypothetical protein
MTTEKYIRAKHFMAHHLRSVILLNVAAPIFNVTKQKSYLGLIIDVVAAEAFKDSFFKEVLLTGNAQYD